MVQVEIEIANQGIVTSTVHSIHEYVVVPNMWIGDFFETIDKDYKFIYETEYDYASHAHSSSSDE